MPTSMGKSSYDKPMKRWSKCEDAKQKDEILLKSHTTNAAGFSSDPLMQVAVKLVLRCQTCSGRTIKVILEWGEEVGQTLEAECKRVEIEGCTDMTHACFRFVSDAVTRNFAAYSDLHTGCLTFTLSVKRILLCVSDIFHGTL